MGKKLKYPKCHAAGMLGKDAKFKMAESLAVEIPFNMGRKADVKKQIEDMVAELQADGIDTRSVETYQQYRAVALWFSESYEFTHNFLWVPGATFTAHHEAYHAGISPVEFAAEPMTVRELRARRGKASKDGDPTRVVSGWSASQRREAAEAMKEAIAADPALMLELQAEYDRQHPSKSKAQQARERMEDSLPVMLGEVTGYVDKLAEALGTLLPMLADDNPAHIDIKSDLAHKLLNMVEWLGADISLHE